MPKLDLSTVPVKTGSIYPAPYAAALEGRAKRALGDVFNLTQFGVNLTVLAPGSSSAHRHWHESEDEFVYVLDEYKGRTNMVYHDDYSAILKWVVEKVSKEDPAAIQKKQVGGSKFSIPEVEF